MSEFGLTAAEREHLAVLRVSAMAHDRATVKIEVRRIDVLAVLAAVDRLAVSSDGPAVRTRLRGGVGTAFFARTVVIFGGSHTYGAPQASR